MSVTEYNLGKVGVTPKGAYDDGATYERLDVVTHAGGSYLSLIDDNTEPLSDDTAWQLLAEKGDSGAKGDRPDHEWDGTEIQFEKPDGSMGEKVDLQGKEGEPGKPGKDGDPGAPGTDGKGWTGGSYDDQTGKVTFTSTDGLGFVTGDIRGSDATATPVIDRLDSTSTTAALSANQGRVLKDWIDESGLYTLLIEGKMESWFQNERWDQLIIFPTLTWDYLEQTGYWVLTNDILTKVRLRWEPYSGSASGLAPTFIPQPTSINVAWIDATGTAIFFPRPPQPSGMGILTVTFPKVFGFDVVAYGGYSYVND